MKKTVIGVLGVLALAVAPASAQSIGLVQTGVTNVVSRRAAVGAEFGQHVNPHVQVFLAGSHVEGWKAVQVTSGVRLFAPTGRVRPYLLGGLGVNAYRDRSVASRTRKTVPLMEGGVGVAAPVGRIGYLDLGYRLKQAYHATERLGGLYAGFGFRY